MLAEYEYDKYNRLVKEKNYMLQTEYVTVYDDGGNITQKKEFALNTMTGQRGDEIFTNRYGYPTNGWKDLLSSYNGQPIIYDKAGNPVSYRGASMTWQNGRQLSAYKKGETLLSFDYDYAGIRTRKNNTYYYAEGSRIIAEKTGSDTIVYYYDESGVYGMEYNGANYYFEKNILGDIVAVYNSAGVLQGRYTYDAWGNCRISGSGSAVLNANPFRYRGYYYDKESNLYYLQTRYYDPETGRFINADDPSIILNNATMTFGANLFAYCMDNPIMLTDNAGNMPDWLKWVLGAATIALCVGLTIISAGGFAAGGAALLGVFGGTAATGLTGVFAGAAVGAAIGAATGIVFGGLSSVIGGKGFWEGAADGFMWGAFSGALSGGLGGAKFGKVDKFVQMIGNAGISFGAYAGQSVLNGDKITLIGSMLAMGGGIAGGALNNAKFLAPFFVDLGFQGAGLLQDGIKRVFNVDSWWLKLLLEA